MLQYSFSTVYMAILAGSILAILIAVAFLNWNIMANAGSNLLAVIVVVAILRLLFPYEFPFAVNVIPPQTISKALTAIQSTRMYIRGFRVSYWGIFELIWVCGIIVKLILGTRNCFHSRNYILKYGTDATDMPRYKEPLDHICTCYDKENIFSVVELRGLDIPSLFYFRKPYILIPKDIAITPGQLQYILRHEALHYFHHDHFIKLAVRLFSYIYWWNPICILLQKQANLLLEMSIDRRLVHENPAATKEYADCLLYMHKQALASASEAPGYLKKDSTFLLHARNSDLKKRCIMLFHDTSPGKKAAVTFLLTAMTVCVYLVSHLYTLEAYYCPPELTETTIVLSPDNTYIVQLNTGVYKIYLTDMLLETVTCLDFYPKGIKIYNAEGELIDET